MTKSIKNFFTGLSKNSFLLAFASLFSDISTEMLYPILPIFLTQILNANGSIVGFIEGVGQATQNITQSFSGQLSDKLKKRKLIALIGFFLAAIAKPLMGIATMWQHVLGGRFLDRFGTGIRSAPRDALIAASVAKKNRGKAFGLEGFGDNLGAFLGPILTLFLLSLFQINIRYIFFLAVIPGILAFLMILFIQEKSVTVTAKSKLDMNLIKLPSIFWRYLLVTALFGLGASSNAFLILETQNIGVSLKITILIYAGYNLVAALISYPAGFLSDLVGRKNILLVGFLIFIMVYLSFALTQHIIILGITFAFYGCYQGIFRSVGKALAMDFAPEELHGTCIGWYSATIGLIQLIASIIAGLLWDHVSHRAVFFYGAFFAAVGSLALMSLVPSRHPHLTT